LSSGSYEPACVHNRPGAYNGSGNESYPQDPFVGPVKTDKGENDFDTQQDSDIGKYPAKILIDQAYAPSVKELYRKGANQCTKDNNAIGAWGQKVIEASNKQNTFAFGTGF